MVSDLVVDNALGLWVLLVGLTLFLAALVLVARQAVSGQLSRALGYAFFIPGRRRVLVRLLLVTTVFLLGVGVANALSLLAWIPVSLAEVAVAATEIGAASVFFLFLFWGLRPRRLADFERATLANSPLAFEALGMTGPFSDSDEG